MILKINIYIYMKYLRSYTNFRNQKIDEKVIFNDNTIKLIIEKQLGKALKNLDANCKPKDVIEWIKSTLLNTKSDSFLLRLPVEEMKVSGGVGGSFLPKGYHGISTPVDIKHELDSGDRNYYEFMFSIFDPQYGLLSDPIDIKSTDINFTGQKNRADYCGLFWLKKVFDKKFGQNQMPYQIVSYMIKTIRNSVSKKIKYSKNISSEEFSEEFQPRINTSDENKDTQPNTESTTIENEKLAPGFFKTETATVIMPDLKQILVKCGGRDLYKKGMLHPEEVKTFAPIAQKKRLSFYNWFIQSVYPSFTQALNELKESDIDASLKNLGVDTKSGKIVYQVGDNVVYLKKDKTIEDWNKIEDTQKQNLEEAPASNVVSTGKVTEVEGDNIKIEYQSGEFTNKTSEEIIKKIEKEEEIEVKEEEAEEVKKEEEVNKKEKEQ